MQSIAVICLGVAVVFSSTVQGRGGSPSLYEILEEILRSEIRSESEGNNKVYVGNLNYQATKLELYTLFEVYGSVEDVTIIPDRSIGRSRGFAFVTFKNSQEAQAAVDGANGSILQGQEITVTIAKERPYGKGKGKFPGRPGRPGK